jgi:hypothetical protein
MAAALCARGDGVGTYVTGPIRDGPYGFDDLVEVDFKIIGLKPPPLQSSQLKCPRSQREILRAHWPRVYRFGGRPGECSFVKCS